MTFRYGFHVGLVVVFLMAPGRLSGEPQASDPSSGRAVAIPRHDILELFGGQAGPGDDAGGGVSAGRPHEAGTSGAPAGATAQPGAPVEAGLTEGLRADEASKAIRRPDYPVLAGGDRSLQSRGIGRDEEGASWRFLKDLSPLLAVLALIVVAALVVKRFMPGRRLLTGSGVLEIVARIPLSQKQSLVLVKMGRRLVLAGVTAEQINTLCLVDDPEQVATLLGEVAGERPTSMTRAFARAFEEEAGAYSSAPAEGDPAAEAGSHVRGLLDKVRRLKRRREVA